MRVFSTGVSFVFEEGTDVLSEREELRGARGRILREGWVLWYETAGEATLLLRNRMSITICWGDISGSSGCVRTLVLIFRE